MTEFNTKPVDTAEKLIGSVFGSLEREADPTIARLHFEHQLKRRQPRRGTRTAIKVMAFLTGLILLAGWAGSQHVTPWDDGQLITFKAPADFEPSDYPHWMAIFANNSAELSDLGGHSLVVDYSRDASGCYYFQLGIIGISYTEANSWTRSVLSSVPDLEETQYAITQPLLPYRVSVREMVAFSLLGDSDSEERKVMEAWRAAGEQPRMIFLVANTKDYAGDVSSLIY